MQQIPTVGISAELRYAEGCNCLNHIVQHSSCQTSAAFDDKEIKFDSLQLSFSEW